MTKEQTKDQITSAVQILYGVIEDLEEDHKKDQIRAVVNELLKFRDKYCYVVPDCWATKKL